MADQEMRPDDPEQRTNPNNEQAADSANDGLSDAGLNEDVALESLLHLHQGMQEIAAIGDIDGVDDEFAADPRSAGCLSMPRLQAIATERDLAESRELWHVEDCPVCAARLAAFRSRLEPLRPSVSSPQPMPIRPTAGRVIGWSAAAAAALVVVALLASLLIAPDQTDPFSSQLTRWDHDDMKSSMAPAPAGQETDSHGIGSEDPALASHFGGPLSNSVWVEGFDQVTDDCAVIAFVRAWDDSCACLRWRLHRWLNADGEVQLQQELASGERFEIEVEIGGSTPPVEQLVLVAAAANAEDLPTSEAAAEELLACLAEPQCLDDANAVATYVNSAPDCFPEGVRLIPRSFIVE